MGKGSVADVSISLVFEDEPIEDAIAAIAELSGVPIEVIGSVDGRRISLELRELGLSESLRRILDPSNHVAIWTPEGQLSIVVLNDTSDPEGPVAEAGERTAAVLEPPIALFPGGDEVVPSDKPGEPGLTVEDLQFDSLLALGSEFADQEVLPPSDREMAGVTI